VKTRLSQLVEDGLRLVGRVPPDEVIKDTVGVPIEMPPVPRRPNDGIALVFATPVGTAALLQGIYQPLREVISDGSTGPVCAGIALALLAGQCFLAIRAGVLALRGNRRGIDLTALALLLSLAACVMLFLAGIRPATLGWGLIMLVPLGLGMFRLDALTANAWYDIAASRADAARAEAARTHAARTDTAD